MCQKCGYPEKGDGILHLIDAIVEASDNITKELKRQKSLELDFQKNMGIQKTEPVAWVNENQEVIGIARVNQN